VALERGDQGLDVALGQTDRGGEVGGAARRALEDEREDMRGAFGV
jgi:hypothetical protein